MRDHKKTDIKVGITVLTAIILLIVVLTWAKNIKIGGNERLLNIAFDNIAGLEVGDNVTVNGVRNGYVNSIKNEGNRVVVGIILEKKISLKKDAVFSIVMLDLMGGKRVEIYPGNSNEEIDYSKTYTGSFAGDIPQLMAFAGSLSSEIPTLMEKINVTLSSLNSFLNDKSLEKDLRNSLNNLSSLTYALKIFISNNETSMSRVIKNSEELTSEMKDFISSNKSDINELLSDIKVVVNQTEELLTYVNKISRETDKGENNLGKVLKDESLFNDLKETLTTVKDLTKLLLQQLQSKGIKVNADLNLF